MWYCKEKNYFNKVILYYKIKDRAAMEKTKLKKKIKNAILSARCMMRWAYIYEDEDDDDDEEHCVRVQTCENESIPKISSQAFNAW